MNTPLLPALSPALSVVPPLARASERSAGDHQDACPRNDRGADETVVAAYGLLMKGHCQRVYHVVRSVLRSPAEIEDVMSQSFVSTFMRAEQVEPMREATWVCRTALNEALVRIRQRGRFVSLEKSGAEARPPQSKRLGADAATRTSDMDIIQVFEDVVDQLPEIYRTVLIMRDVEGMAVAEVAAILNVDVETVKMRLQRGRTLLKDVVKGYNPDIFQSAFPLQDELCGRVTAAVMDALRWTLRLSDRERACSPVASSARATAGRA